MSPQPISFQRKQLTSSLSVPCRSRAARLPRSRYVVSRCVQTTENAYTPPSAVTAATELDALGQLSQLIPDTLLFEAKYVRPRAATVSAAVLRGITSKSQLGLRPYENALLSALTSCSGKVGDEKFNCQYDQALVNIGTVSAKEVEGRVATEVDPRLAKDKGAIVDKVHTLKDLYAKSGIPVNKVIFRIPATWQGIKAAEVLEGEGINTQVYMVYSLIQGIAAAQAGVSVIQPSVGRVRDWYSKHPGVIRDPKGPRQDASSSSAVDPGRLLVQQLYAYIKRHHPKTLIMATGLRNKEDALALSGCDYLVLGASLLAALAASPTTAGYNDGLSAADGESGMEAALGPDLIADLDMAAAPPVTATSFEEGLGLAGAALVKSELESLIGDVAGLGPIFSRTASGRV